MEDLGILLIEKDEEKAAQITKTLTGIGQRVVGTASDVQAAVWQAARLRPDLVIAHLPAGPPMNEAATQLLAAHSVPIVLLADRQDEAQVQSSLHAGTMSYHLPPFTASGLLETIETAYARFEEQTALQRKNEDLKADMETRRFVERAKGVLMVRLEMTEAAAHDWLRERSRERRMPVREFAKRILEAHEAGKALPGTTEEGQ